MQNWIPAHPAYTNPLAEYPVGDPFFSGVDYAGAFSASAGELWINEWTALAANGHLADLTVSVKAVADPSLDQHVLIYPNPINSGGTLQVVSKLNTSYDLQLLSPEGRIVLNKSRIVSENTLMTVPELSSGLYFLKITTVDGRFYTSRLMIN